MKKVVIDYKCGLCLQPYKTEAEALECYNKGIAGLGKFKVGDVVKHMICMGWYDADAKWILPERNPDGCIGFYYVVAAVTRDDHTIRLDLITNAMSGEHGYRIHECDAAAATLAQDAPISSRARAQILRDYKAIMRYYKKYRNNYHNRLKYPVCPRCKKTINGIYGNITIRKNKLYHHICKPQTTFTIKR